MFTILVSEYSETPGLGPNLDQFQGLTLGPEADTQIIQCLSRYQNSEEYTFSLELKTKTQKFQPKTPSKN